MSLPSKSFQVAGNFNMLPRTPAYARWIFVVFVITAVFLFHPSISTTAIIQDSLAPASFAPVPGHDDVTWVKEVLQRYKVGPEVTYAARTIKYIPDQQERKSITEVDHELIPQQFVDVNFKRVSTLPPASTVEVHIKKSMRPDDVDASDLIFGVSTTFERFSDPKTTPVGEWKRWLTDGQGHSNGAGIVLALYNATDANIANTTELLHSVGINATVYHASTKLDMAGRYVRLVSLVYNHPTRDSRKYFVLIDDDTFFPCLDELQRVLTKYDPKKKYYIGTFTERSEWLLRDLAAFGFGGGGIFLTAPMAKEIADAPCLEGEILPADKEHEKPFWKYNLDANQGDRLLFNCIVNYTDTRLTYFPRLHQVDQYGDLSGFYENGDQPLSLHHYKSWHHFDVEKMHYVADACGEDCVLQRFQFKDNFIVTNGYSVAHYPHGIDFDPLMVEDTFENFGEIHDVDLAYSMGAQRPTLSFTGKKKAWRLLDSRNEGDGKVRQVYLKHKSDPTWLAEKEAPPKDDSIVVLLWVP